MNSKAIEKLEKAIDETVIAYATNDIEIVRAKTQALINEGRNLLAALREPPKEGEFTKEVREICKEQQNEEQPFIAIEIVCDHIDTLEAKKSEEHKTRIKYQDIVYAICQLFDEGIGNACTIFEVVAKVEQLQADLASAEERIEGLEKYAQHSDDCQRDAPARLGICTCGLEQVLKAEKGK